jgi:hypothetical protein
MFKCIIGIGLVLTLSGADAFGKDVRIVAGENDAPQVDTESTRATPVAADRGQVAGPGTDGWALAGAGGSHVWWGANEQQSIADIGIRPTPALTQISIRDAIARAVDSAMAAPQSAGSARRANNMFWGGIGLIGGGAALAVLGATVAKSEECADFGFLIGRICIEETNKVLAYSGGALAGLGGLFVGLSYLQDVHLVPGGVVVRHRLSFPGRKPQTKTR